MSNAAAFLFDDDDLPRARDPVLYICHEVEGVPIDQRRNDGFIDATAMCRAYKTDFTQFSRTDEAKRFIAALDLKLHICSIETERGRYGRTWVDPHLAIRLAMWLSPEFAVLVTQWVLQWMQGRQPAFHKDDVEPFVAGRLLKKLEEIDDRTKRIEITGLETWVSVAMMAHNGSVYSEQLALELPPTPPQPEQPERQPRGSRGQPIPKLVEPRK